MEDLTQIQKERDVQKNVLKLFSYSPLWNFFEIRTDVRWVKNNSHIKFDIALLRKGMLYAIVEIKKNLLAQSQLKKGKQQIAEMLQLTNCRFGIITDSNKCLLKDMAYPNKDFIEMDFNQIIDKLIKPSIIPMSKGGYEKIMKALKIFFKDDTTKIAMICEDIVYDDNQGEYFFDSLDKERIFFSNVFNSSRINNSPIYRYTSLDTLISMFNKGTYRMNGIVGMNDRSEINYFDNFDKESEINTSWYSAQEINDTYLSSCCSVGDDLTMWRLYGDDGKGVCLVFEILPQEKRHKGFVLAPINYAEERGKHTAIKMLRKLSDAKMRFRELYKWKHFFKPYEYNIEDEIRLIFFDNRKYNNGDINRDWVKTWNHSIINPIIDFKLNSPGFPLQLKRIVLGPKMQELDTNKSQLEYYISQKGYSIDVEKSKIDNYR